MDASPAEILRLTGIRKSFAGVQALKGVDFDLRAGEIHALVGENGAGKSTLIRVISGALRADAGTLAIAGTIVAGNTPALSRRLGVAVIYQQPVLFAELSVAENIALGAEPPGAWRRVRWDERLRRATALLERVGARIDPRRRGGDLSIAEQQLVEIARALGDRARVLILDEPTAALPAHEARRLLATVRELRAGGVGIVYISHRLDEVEAIAERVTVLRDGASVGCRPMAGVDRETLIRLMVGRAVEQRFPARVATPGPTVLSCRGLGCRAGVAGIDLDLRAGSITGLAGLVGSGRSGLARTLFGLTPADQGEIRLRGVPVRIGSPRQAIDLGIAYLPEDRRRHGVIGEMSMAANTSLAVLRRLTRWGLIDRGREDAMAREAVERFAIKTAGIDAAVSTLSGGNQQKVALARWLRIAPAVILLDEPTQGVDVGAKAEIHRLIAALADGGPAVLLISNELPEVLGLSDRVLVMRAGRIAGELERAEATQERVMGLALGQVAAQVAQA